jgi:hypothetical protein
MQRANGRRFDAEQPNVFVLRPITVRLFAATAAAIMNLLAVGIVGGLLPERFGRAAALVLLVATPIVFLRGLRISLLADQDEIVVRNYFTTHILKWSEVSNVGIGIHHFFAQLPAVAIELHTSKSWITSQATVSGEKECQRVVRALSVIGRDHPVEFSL